jgi:DNA-binding response OmpR family regulator
MVKKIVVVDDDRGICNLLSKVFTGEGYITECVYNGKDALKKIDEILPDLVILDIMLPDLNGYQVLELMKKSEKTKNVKVVMLTQKDLLKDVEQAMTLGADNYIVKPFDINRILKTVNEILIS